MFLGSLRRPMNRGSRFGKHFRGQMRSDCRIFKPRLEALEDRLAPSVLLLYGGPLIAAALSDATNGLLNIVEARKGANEYLAISLPSGTFDTNSTQSALGLTWQVPGSPGTSTFATIDISTLNNITSLTANLPNYVVNLGPIFNTNGGLGNINGQAGSFIVTDQVNVPGMVTLATNGASGSIQGPGIITASTANFHANYINAMTAALSLSANGGSMVVTNVSPLTNLNVTTSNGPVNITLNNGAQSLTFDPSTSILNLSGATPATNLSFTNTAGGVTIAALATTGDASVTAAGDLFVRTTLSAKSPRPAGAASMLAKPSRWMPAAKFS
jgi:hypothetical protein